MSAKLLPASKHSPASIPVISSILPDASLVELIRIGNKYELLHIGASQDLGFEILDSGGELHIDDKIFVPATSAALDRVVLPAALDPSCNLDETFERLANCLSTNLYLSPDEITLTAHFIILTWIADFLHRSPVLVALGTYSTHFDNLETLLRALCSRSQVYPHLSATDFRRLPFEIQPTLILTDPKLQHNLESLLGATRKSNQCISIKGRPHNIRCALALLTANTISDERLQFDCVEISVLPRPVTVLTEGVVEKISSEFQPKLLAFRAKIALQREAQEELDNLSLYSGYPNLQKRVTAALKPAIRRKQDEVSTSVEAHVIEALFFHYGLAQDGAGPSRVHVGEITETVNQICISRHAPSRHSARRIGSALRKLNLPTRKLNSRGFGLVINPAILDQLQNLAALYDVKFRELIPTKCNDSRVAKITAVKESGDVCKN